MPQATLSAADRERIVYGHEIPWGSRDEYEGVRDQFARIGPLGPMEEGIDTETARQLIDEEHMDPRATQNRSPTMSELVTLGESLSDEPEVDWVEYTGYMIGPERPDTRITLTGIRVHPNEPGTWSNATRGRFRNTCRQADDYGELHDLLHAWWD